MKFRISLKDPDGFSDSVKDAVLFTCKDIDDEAEFNFSLAHRTENIWDFLSDYVYYQEYLMIEVDTDEKTVKVVKRNE